MWYDIEKTAVKQLSKVIKTEKGEYFYMIITLDRIEEDICVFVSDDGETLTFERERFAGIKEGDIFDLTDGVFTPLEREQEKRTNEAKRRLDALFAKGERDKKE